VPALIDSIKESGLLLVTDNSNDSTRKPSFSVPSSSFSGIPDGVDGLLNDDGVLRFREPVGI
jgi:hypothetical protein